MKILHVGQMIGGIGVYIRNTITAADGSIDYVIVSGKDDQNKLVMKDGKVIKEYKVDLYRELSLKDLKGLFQIIRIIRNEKPDLIHCHSAKGGFLGRWAGWLCHVTTLYTPHAYSFLSSQKQVKKRLFTILERLARHDSYMLACSGSERELGIKEVHYNESHALVWHNSVPDALSVVEKEEAERGTDTVFKVCCVGRPCYQKNTLFLIEVLKKVVEEIPDTKCYLLGVGYYSPDLEKVQMLIKQYGLEENIEMTPWLPQKETFEYIRNSDIYLTVSRYEGLPLSVIEAMSLGCPVIASDVPGNVDCVKNGTNGYLLPSDASVFASRIIYLYRHPEVRKEMGVRSRELFEQHFCIDTQIKKLLKIYSEAVETSRNKNRK